MTNFNVSIPAELKSQMDQFPDINWSDITQRAIRQIIADLNFLREFKSNSTMTSKDAEILGRKVSEAVGKRLQELE